MFGRSPVELCHSNCLRCRFCGDLITVRDEPGTCRTVRCWISGLGVACAVCRQRLTHCARCIQPLQYHGNVQNLGSTRFHLECLTCLVCNRVLVQGDRCVITHSDEVHGLGVVCTEHVMDQTISQMTQLDHHRADETVESPDSHQYPLERPRTLSVGSADSGLSVSAGTTSTGEMDLCNGSLLDCSTRDHRPQKLENMEIKNEVIANPESPNSELELSTTNYHNTSADSVEMNNIEHVLSDQSSVDQLNSPNASVEQDYVTHGNTAYRLLPKTGQRKPRTSFHPIQLSILRAYFLRDPHPTSGQLNDLAELIQLDRKQVQVSQISN
ncbi:hypothetical protein FGIG_02896 [Fasciola gigantica]|uniref:Uncharacterized protein n=1 Tax=Fasciola gigantica TaxID=46835 RepID=A0A504YCX2_FASGI|nr:hypothetical protein FGIG_02896 [Fasciola gigantica]